MLHRKDDADAIDTRLPAAGAIVPDPATRCHPGSAIGRAAARRVRRRIRRLRWTTLRRISRQRLRWAVRIRAAAIALFLTVAVAAWLGGIFASPVPALVAACAGTVWNFTAGRCVRRWRGPAALMVWSGIGDAVIITYVVVSTGGTASPFLFLYVVQVLTSALVVDTGAGAVSAALSVGCWALASWLGPLPARFQAPPIADAGRAVWAASLALTLVLLVFIGGYLAQRLARRERELAGAHHRLRRSMERLARAHAELGDAYGRLARAGGANRQHRKDAVARRPRRRARARAR